MGRLLLNHGDDQPLETVLQGIVDPASTELAFYLGAPPGRSTCKAACEHCFIPFNPQQGDEGIDFAKQTLDDVIRQEREQITDLRQWGFKVVPTVADTFAHNGAYLRSGLLDTNLLYSQDELEEAGIAWTSGLPLLAANYKDLLRLARSNNLKVVAITHNGLADHEVPLKGIVQPTTVRRVIDRINEYNGEQSADEQLEISLTFTVGKYNLDKGKLLSYIAHVESLGATYIRFNRFIDFTPEMKFSERMLSPEDNRTFFRLLREINSEYAGPVHMMVSTDFSGEGEEELSDGKINRCGGGSHGFSVLRGLIYPCVEFLQTPIGKIVKLASSEAPWKPEGRSYVYGASFNDQFIRRLAAIKADERHKGCVAYTMQYYDMLLQG